MSYIFTLPHIYGVDAPHIPICIKIGIFASMSYIHTYICRIVNMSTPPSVRKPMHEMDVRSKEVLCHGDESMISSVRPISMLSFGVIPNIYGVNATHILICIKIGILASMSYIYIRVHPLVQHAYFISWGLMLIYQFVLKSAYLHRSPTHIDMHVCMYVCPRCIYKKYMLITPVIPIDH